MKKLLAVVFLGLTISLAFGDIVQLKDGTILRGKIYKADSQVVEILDAGGIQHKIPRDKVSNITYEPSSPPISVGVPASTTSLQYSSHPDLDKSDILGAAAAIRSFSDLSYGAHILTTTGTVLMLTGVTMENTLSVVVGGTGVITGLIFEFIAYYVGKHAGDHLEDAVK